MTTLLSPNNYCAKMGKFKAKVLRFANSDPNNPLSPSQLTLIHHQLNAAFPDFHTPTHPPYSLMILNAISKLNEEDGSKEELISEYVKKEYKGLPWAHDMYLSYHLSKLCENGEIVYDSTSKCYTKPDCARSQADKSRKKGRKRRLVRKRKESVTEDKEGILGGEKLFEESGDMIGFQEVGIEKVERHEDEDENVSGSFGVEVSGFLEEDVEEFGRSNTKPRRRSLVFIECDEGEQNARPNKKLASEDKDCNTNDAANLMRETAECVEEAPLNLISSSDTNIRGENDCDLAVNTVQAGIQEANLRKKQLKEQFERNRKRLVDEDVEGDLGGEKVVEVHENQIEFQEENIEECRKSRAKLRGRSLVVAEDNDEVVRTASDGEKLNSVVESYNEVSAQGDTSDAGNMILVPCASVEESPMTLISSSVTNFRCNNVPELTITKSALKERELMIVPYKGDTSICEVRAEINPITDTKDKMIVCGLPSITEQLQPVRKNSQKLACLKKRRRRNLKVSLETMPSLPPLADDRNLLEHNQVQKLLFQRAIVPKVSEIENEMGPLWLERMLKEQYFIRCSVHMDSLKPKCNRFCLDCMGDAFCFNCLPHHEDHHIVQVRKYSCHKVVRTHDIQRYIDISNVLTYKINIGEVLFIDVGPQRSSKDATRCEICGRGRTNSFRFCSLYCKLIAARQKSTKFLPIDQSRQACTLSLLDGTSIEQLDKQKNFNASQFSSLEDPMSVEDEENLPLQKVLEKHGKRKNQVELKFTANTPLATETANIIVSKLPLDVQTSEYSKHQRNDQERQGQMDAGFGDIEASISSFVQGDVPTSYYKCEQEPKQSEAIKDDSIGVLDIHLQVPKGLDEPVTDLDSQKQTKQLKMDVLGKMTEERETNKEDVSDSSNLYAHEQKGLFEPATNQHSQQQIKPEDDAQGRPLKLLEEAKDDATFTSDLHHQQQAGSSEPETVVQGKEPEKKGRGRPRKCNIEIKEGQESGETNKKPNKVGQGRQRKQPDVNKEDLAVLHEPDHKLEGREHIMDDCLDKSQSETHDTLERKQVMPFKPVTDLDSQKQTKLLRMDGLGKTMAEKETIKEDVADCSNLYAHGQKGLFEPTTNQHSQQQLKPEDDAQGRPLEHLEEAKNDATFTSDLHHQQLAVSSEPDTVVHGKRQENRELGRPSKRTRGTKEGQESEELKEKPKKVCHGRSRKQEDVNKEDSAVLLEPAVEEMEHIMDDCPDKSQSEVYDTLERKQAIPSSDDDIQQRKEQNLDGGDQPDKQQEEVNCHDIEVKGKSEVESQIRRPKEKSRKSSAIQVPLSSKDQLRSRIKHQSQNRT